MLAMSSVRKLRCREATFILLAIASISTAKLGFSEDLDSRQLSKAYEHKTYILRTFYASDHLNFDSKGSPLEASRTGDWTAYGLIVINKFRISSKGIRIDGDRLVVFADHNMLSLMNTDEPVRLTLAPGASKPTVEEVNSALSKIFLSQNDSFVDVIPDYWKPCVKVALARASTAPFSDCRFSDGLAKLLGAGKYAKDDPALAVAGEVRGDLLWLAANEKSVPVGPGVAAARILTQQEPEFSEPGRKFHLQGVLMLALRVNPSGEPENIRVARPLGAGFDENAVRTVQQWKFKPAEKDGKPVACQIGIEVSFHLE